MTCSLNLNLTLRLVKVYLKSVRKTMKEDGHRVAHSSISSKDIEL